MRIKFVAHTVEYLVRVVIGSPARLVLGPTCKGYFAPYYERLRRFDRREEKAAKAILKRLALRDHASIEELVQVHREAVGGRGRSAGACLDLLDRMEDDFYVRRRQEHCAFASGMLRDWWRRYYAF